MSVLWIVEAFVCVCLSAFPPSLPLHTTTTTRFYMMGFNIMAASHFDEYLVDFTSFKPGPIDAAVFEAPALCHKKHHKPTQDMQEEQQLLGAQAMSAGAAVMPWARAVRDSNGNADAATAESPQQLQQLKRLAALARNAEYVRSWNEASNAGFKLSLNRFADWLPEEYSLLRGKRSSSRSEQVKQVGVLRNMYRHTYTLWATRWLGCGLYMRLC